MGDPSFVKGLPWDVGTANNTSYFPRQDTDACDPVADQSEFAVGGTCLPTRRSLARVKKTRH